MPSGRPVDASFGLADEKTKTYGTLSPDDGAADVRPEVALGDGTDAACLPASLKVAKRIAAGLTFCPAEELSGKYAVAPLILVPGALDKVLDPRTSQYRFLARWKANRLIFSCRTRVVGIPAPTRPRRQFVLWLKRSRASYSPIARENAPRTIGSTHGDYVSPKVSLQRKLETDYQLRLPEFEQAGDLDAYWAAVGRTTRSRAG